jgi:hypothetical protein
VSGIDRTSTLAISNKLAPLRASTDAHVWQKSCHVFRGFAD